MPMINTAIITRLQQHYPALQTLSGEQLNLLLPDPRVISLPAGTIVFDENQTCQGFPMLLSGSIRVIKAAPNGRELQLYRVHPGESCILTSSCLLGHSHYTARGIVEHDAELLMLTTSNFNHLIQHHTQFRDYIFHLFAERLTDLMQLVTAVAFQKLDQRLAATLIKRNAPILSTHQALADELGSSREIISRILKGFADQGWVSLGREQIEIVNQTALKQLAEF
ncbi:Crp/Fnr family transcriptional regulator [Sulfuriferula nivalis]|uniref:Crp/Fnr family transcriptional regulator n=2 Tax=Sulfuriferula nivalis TaxID=2675298 RepID=A0A809RJS9_9PROT|nr:Crp/Fnr family transcriptional regulator [Sulfuriferula nivalis]